MAIVSVAQRYAIVAMLLPNRVLLLLALAAVLEHCQ